MQKTIKFHKMHGLLNDFIIIKTEKESIELKNIAEICNRQQGIGCDQLLIVNEDNIVQIYNQDGSKATFCGNGFRCLISFLGNFRNKTIKLKTDSGVVMGMGCDKKSIIRYPNKIKYQKLKVDFCNEAFFVNVGNEHIVCLNSDLNIEELHSRSKYFLNRDVNVFNVTNHNQSHAKAVGYERGAGPTKACGSGGAAIAYTLMTEKYNTKEYTIEMPGGSMENILKNDHLWQRADINYVFQGEYYY